MVWRIAISGNGQQRATGLRQQCLAARAQGPASDYFHPSDIFRAPSRARHRVGPWGDTEKQAIACPRGAHRLVEETGNQQNHDKYGG